MTIRRRATMAASRPMVPPASDPTATGRSSPATATERPSARQLPGECLARAEGPHRTGGARHFFRNRPAPRLEGDALLIERQAVEARTVERGEGFEPVERLLFGEDLRIDLERR